MGRFEKGKSGNPAGRPKGAKDKVQSSVKEWVKELIDKNRANFESDLRMCDPEDRLRFLLKLLDYILPKQAAVQNRVSFENMTDEQIDDIVSRLVGGTDNEDND